MNQDLNRQEELFKQALLKPSATERSAFLNEACCDDPALRAHLEVLLEGHFMAQGFLDSVPAHDQQPVTRVAAASTYEQPGDRIGRYKLLQNIGEGGCGAVYMAE